MRVTKRDYKDEYQKFQSGGVQKKRRALRNKNRRKMEAGGRVSKGDGMDIHHKGNYTKIMTYGEKLKEAAARRKRNEELNAINRRRGKPAVFDETSLRNKDGSPLRGGPKKTPIAPKEIPTKTPEKTLKRSKAVIPVPTKKQVRQAKRKNRK